MCMFQAKTTMRRRTVLLVVIVLGITCLLAVLVGVVVAASHSHSGSHSGSQGQPLPQYTPPPCTSGVDLQPLQLWVERGTPFTQEYLAELTVRLLKGTGCITFDRVIIRVIDPANTKGTNEFDTGGAFMSAFLVPLAAHGWKGDVFVLPYVVKGEPWRGAAVSTQYKSPIQQAVDWVLQMNTAAAAAGGKAVTGVVFEVENSGYTSKEALTDIDAVLAAKDQRLKRLIAPQVSAKTVAPDGWDEVIMQVYNITNDTVVQLNNGALFESGSWGVGLPNPTSTAVACNSTQPGRDGHGRGVCGFIKSGPDAGKPVGDPVAPPATQDPVLCGTLAKACAQLPSPHWQAVDTVLSSSTDLATIPNPNTSMYTLLRNRPSSLANWFNWYLLRNHGGTPSNYFGGWAPRDVPIAAQGGTVSFLFSTECVSDKCMCPPLQKALPRQGCGTIDAFGAGWCRSAFEQFLDSVGGVGSKSLYPLSAASVSIGQRMGIFQYNMVPTSWWQAESSDACTQSIV